MHAHKVPDTTALIPLHPAHTPPTTGPQHLLTPRKQAAFCKALAGHGNVRLACRAAQVSPQTAYRARRASHQFRQCWDAALVIAREHVEQVLADRALNGVEEKVFYHGEEVATRRRYDSRLLLAHLARLDRKAEERVACDICHAPLLDEGDFDAAVQALEEGGEEARGEAGDFAPGQCSMCSTLARERVLRQARDEREREARACPQCGGRCAEWRADPSVPLTPADCMWLGNRLDRMDAARPHGAALPHELPGGDPDGALEEIQLMAFEDGIERWWEITLPDEEEGEEDEGERDADAGATASRTG